MSEELGDSELMRPFDLLGCRISCVCCGFLTECLEIYRYGSSSFCEDAYDKEQEELWKVHIEKIKDMPCRNHK
jgi:hypothetical protein